MPFPYVDLSSYISGASANGINPTDITAFDGNAYFDGSDSAGHQGLFELQAESETGYIGFTLSSISAARKRAGGGRRLRIHRGERPRADRHPRRQPERD